MEHRASLRIAHLVDAMDGDDHLWGKERVVQLLMREQRNSGVIEPRLITFSAGLLATVLCAEGFSGECLSARRSHGFTSALGPLRRSLAERPVDVVHSHGYRANIIAKMLRLSGGMPGVRLISTHHGWDKSSPNLRLYHTVDRLLSPLSDVSTVPDARMLTLLPPVARGQYVPNGVADDAHWVPHLPRAGRAPFTVGTLGRVTAAKGILDVLAVARTFADPTVTFTVAGAGDLTGRVSDAGANVRYAGYFAHSGPYLAGLDVYLQASHAEGLSLALLEAMRAGKPIVATNVGATAEALSDGENALVIPPHAPAALAEAVMRLRREPALAARLGANARRRFERDFRIERQHGRYLDLYGRTGS